MNYRDLLLKRSDGSAQENEWLNLSDNPATHKDPIDHGVRDFLTANPLERQLFYKMFPQRGRLIAWYMIRTGRGQRLIPELVLVQNLLQAESADDLQYTMLCYSLECRESASLFSRLLGLQCSASCLSAIGQGSFAKKAPTQIAPHMAQSKVPAPSLASSTTT